MPLIQSLFCHHGFDNRTRFYTIILICYFSFLLLNALVPNNLFSLIILFFSTYVVLLTTIRRLKDAQLKKSWLLVSTASYLFSGMAIIWLDNSYANWFIVLPLLISALLLTYPSKQNKKYILGYAGPINLSIYENNYHQQRIEPVLIPNDGEQLNTTITEPLAFTQQAPLNTNEKTTNDKGELLREYLLQHSKKLTIALGAFFTLIILIMLFSSEKNSPVNTTKTKKQAIKSPASNHVEISEIALLERLAPLALPDNFTLMLSQYNGVIIHWQAPENSTTQLWSIISAKGDESCKHIIFNKKEFYRSLAVIVENNHDLYAYFSPLDSQKLLKAIALQNSFSVCGFTFSLKGSQAALGKNSTYANFINY